MGYIVEMVIDLDKKYEIHYIINDINYGKAFNLKNDTHYRADVCLYARHDSVQLISYK